MSSAISLVSAFLTTAQKTEIVKKLANDLTNPENAAVLSELISQLDPSTIDEVYPQILRFCENSICEGDEKTTEFAILFITQSDKLCSDVLAHIHNQLKQGLTTHFNFVTGYSQLVDHFRPEDTTEFANEKILNLFEFLSLLFTRASIPESETSASIDQILSLYLGHNDDKISLLCSKLTRWRISSLVSRAKSSDAQAQYLWNTVFKLIETGTLKRHRANAFITWLRILNTGDAHFNKNEFFQQKMIAKNFYWETLQNGLVSNSHEIRKFCLSILQLSLKAISTSFETKLLTWDTDNQKNLLKDWSRYTTVFEILGIDTSLHQTQAAVNDILSLISRNSLIHPSWGFCLLSTGFQASMDSVRKYSMQILLSIEGENLLMVRYALPYLENTFLPYMMLSRHFAVRLVKQHSKELRCVYGEKFCEFLCRVVASLESDLEIEEVALSILRVLNNSRESFDAVRIYATLGLLKGLGSRKALKFGVHDLLLLRLFDNFSEGELYKTAVQTLNLKLILRFKLDRLSDFFDLLTSFNNFNGFQIFNDHIDDVANYVLSAGSDNLMEYLTSNKNEPHRVAAFRILESCKVNSDQELKEIALNETYGFHLTLLQSGMNINNFSEEVNARTQTIFDLAAKNQLSPDLFEKLSDCEFPHGDSTLRPIDVSELFKSIKENVQSEDYGVLALSLYKFKFLNNYLTEFGLSGLPLSVEFFAKFTKCIFCNSSGCARTVTDFYKLKEAVFGEFHRLVSIYVAHTEISQSQDLLSTLTFGLTHFTTLHLICSILEKIFDSDSLSQDVLENAIESLTESIEELNTERFKLSDKELHAYLIKVMLYPTVLENTTKSEKLNTLVAHFCSSMLASSYGRRGIFTRMMEQLSQFQILQPALFENIPFIPNLLVSACCHRQLDHSAFKLEGVVGKLYDDQLRAKDSEESEQQAIYSQVYGDEEVAGKVWTIAMLNSITTNDCAVKVVDYCFSTSTQHNFYDIIKATDGVEERYRLQLLKAVLSVIDKIDTDHVVSHYYKHFLHIVESDPSPLVRVYGEWLIALVLMNKPELSEPFFEKLVPSPGAPEIKPTLVTVYERILYILCQSMKDPLKTKYLTRLVTIILPAASTNKAITRHFSMSLAVSVHREISENNLQLESSLQAVVENMYQSALASEAFGQYRSGDALLWNIESDLTLVQISGGLLVRLFDREVEFITSSDFHKYLNQNQQAALSHPIGTDQSELWVSELKKKQGLLQESSDVAQSPLQTKSGAWSTVMDVDEGGPEVVRSDLIVVASLVDKPPNLGGICRLCDVLGAGTMTLHDMKVKDNQQFKSVAVTADHWMPMVEVRPENIVEYLRQQKADGYTLIGLEQTDKSVVLDSSLEFPRKSLILLGREKEGVPGELLAELDFCVEINQVGVIRSMNIQTATAVIVHAYSTQHCK